MVRRNLRHVISAPPYPRRQQEASTPKRLTGPLQCRPPGQDPARCPEYCFRMLAFERPALTQINCVGTTRSPAGPVPASTNAVTRKSNARLFAAADIFCEVRCRSRAFGLSFPLRRIRREREPALEGARSRRQDSDYCPACFFMASAISAFTASGLKLAPFCIGGESMAVRASLATSSQRPRWRASPSRKKAGACSLASSLE